MRLIPILVVQMIAVTALFGVDLGRVRMEVVDAFGSEVTSGIKANLYKDGTRVAEAVGGSPLLLQGLPYEHYRLEIVCPGFRIYSGLIRISEPDRILRIGLRLDHVGDPEPKGLVLSGKVLRCARGPAMWIRLVGIFTDDTAQTRVRPDCSFRIPDLVGGRYFGILLDGTTVKDTKEVTVDQGSAPLVFDK